MLNNSQRKIIARLKSSEPAVKAAKLRVLFGSRNMHDLELLLANADSDSQQKVLFRQLILGSGHMWGRLIHG